MERTYRMTVHGRFVALTAQQKERLRAEQHDHGIFSARFSPEGCFLYGPELVGYQFRYEVKVDEESPDDAELYASMRAEEQAQRDAETRGFAGRIVRITAVCVEDMKVRAVRPR